MADLGKLNSLRVTRQSTPGLYLDGDALGEVLLPNRVTPPGAKVGDTLKVFVYRDLDGRLLATTETPLAMVGEVAALRVTGYLSGSGVLLDWGLEDELLMPQREQEAPVQKGELVVVHLYEDPQTHRIHASSRLQERLVGAPANYWAGQPVDLLIVRGTPLGYVTLIDGAHLGLLYRKEGHEPMKPGDKVQGYIGTLRTDGKLDLTLDSSGRHRVTTLAEQIFEALQARGGRLDLDDDSPPEFIRAEFGASKKAFKQAVSALFRQRKIVLTKPGIELVRGPQGHA